MQVLITGASGFIGKHLIEVLLSEGYSVIAVSRDPSGAIKRLPPSVRIISYDTNELKDGISESDAVINLAGDPIASGRWTDKKKAALINSRLHTAQRLVNAVKSSKNKNIVFIQASAIGFYGNSKDKHCTEDVSQGEGFLAEICAKWESHIPALNDHVRKSVIIRIGLVLGTDGGMLQELLKQSKRRLAGKIGNGKQWMSWIHIYDLVFAIIYLMNNDKTSGVYNLVAPQPARQKEFAQKLSNITRRKFQLSAPAFMIRSLLGEMGKELLLSGQNVSSAKIGRAGFIFKFEKLENALWDLLPAKDENRIPK